MIVHTVRIAVVAVLSLAGACGAASAQTPPPAPPAANPGPVPPAPYVMGMGDLMNTLIQPRHAKLGLAGRAENWALANYALSELRQVFERIGKAVPNSAACRCRI